MSKKIINDKFRDLGTVISATGIANDGYAYSDVIYDVEKYTRAVFHCKSNQAWELYCFKVREDGTIDWGNSVTIGLSATSTAFSGLTIDAIASINGYGIKFGMKNKSGGAVAAFTLKAQLIGY